MSTYYSHSSERNRYAQLIRDSERADFDRARQRAWQGVSIVEQVTNDILNAIMQPSQGVFNPTAIY